MFIECPICPIIVNNVKNYILDIKKIFTPQFETENYYKHLEYSALIAFPWILFLLRFAHLAGTGYIFPIVIGGFSLYAVNFFREWYCGIKYKAPWDWTDLNMGSYGGILGAIFAMIFNHLINLYLAG
jgi:hypothetical protein